MSPKRRFLMGVFFLFFFCNFLGINTHNITLSKMTQNLIISSDEVTSNSMGNFERFHFFTLIFNRSATNVFLENFFVWISHVTPLNCIVVVSDPNMDLKLPLPTLFFSADFSKFRHKYLMPYFSMTS